MKSQLFPNERSTLEISSFVLFLYFTSYNALGVQGGCPARCLCQLNMEPSIVVCAKQSLTEFPSNISNLVSTRLPRTVKDS